MQGGDPCTVVTPHGRIRAQHVVMATHTPKGVHMIHTALAPYREYGIAARMPAGLLPPGIYWTADDPHHSVRTHAVDGQEYLVVVGGSHKTGQQEDTDACHAELAHYARTKFGLTVIDHRWSAQNYKASDGLPYIGRSGVGENVLIATGFAADGLTYGALSASILTDLILGHDNAHAATFAADRHRPLAAAKDYVAENLNVMAQYLRDWPGSSEARSLAEVRTGEARIVEVEREKVAAFRDEAGHLHAVSAVCTHEGCLVRWNRAQTSWDCPCHGSRFSVDGEVLVGPAVANLPPMDPPADGSGGDND